MINVVCACIFRHGRIFLGLRKHNRSDFPWTWECPGGMVEEGETHEAALQRELEEELDIGSGIIETNPICIWSGELQSEGARFDRRHILLTFYKVSVNEILEIQATKVHDGYGWFTEAEFVSLNLAPGNRAANVKILSRWPKK